MKMIKIFIHANTLTDDMLERDGEHFKLTYYTPRNEWSDDEHIIEGDNLDDIIKQYQAKTGRLDDIQYTCGGPETTRETIEDINYMEG